MFQIYPNPPTCCWVYKLYIMCSPTSVYLRLPQKSVLQLRTPLLWVRYYINFLQQQQYRNDNSFKTDFDGPPMSFDYFNTVPEYVYNNLQLPCLFIYQFGGKLKAPIQIFPPIYLIICYIHFNYVSQIQSSMLYSTLLFKGGLKGRSNKINFM